MSTPLLGEPAPKVFINTVFSKYFLILKVYMLNLKSQDKKTGDLSISGSQAPARDTLGLPFAWPVLVDPRYAVGNPIDTDSQAVLNTFPSA